MQVNLYEKKILCGLGNLNSSGTGFFSLGSVGDRVGRYAMNQDSKLEI